VRFLFGSLILHQKGMGFLIFWEISESCLLKVLKKTVILDKSTETQDKYGLTNGKEFAILVRK
jgi:hypothetical protein